MPAVNDARSKLVILGIGDDGLAGLTEPARRILMDADLILGAPPILSLLDGVPARKEPLEPDMSLALRQVREALEHRRPVLVSGGDPLFYGVARYLCDRLGKDLFEVVPHVSSMQLAFARIKESWEDAYLTSLAGRPIEAVVDRIRTAEKVGVFSSDECPPSRLARELLDRGIDYFRAYVCENLGSPDERVTQGELTDLAATDFNPLNVVILIRKPNRPDRAMLAGRHRLFGNPDDAFAQSLPKRGLITQAEVRAIALAQLDIRADQRGLGHRRRLGLGGDRGGPARAPGDGLRHRAGADRRRADPGQCRVVRGPQRAAGGGARRPRSSRRLPEPDAIFVGGTGRQVDPVLSTAYARLVQGGSMAVNVATIEGLAAAYQVLKGLAGSRQRLERLDRARDRADGPPPVRGDRPHVPPGRDQDGSGQ